MDQAAALDQFKKSAHTISMELMRLHPAAGALEDLTARDAIYPILFELTKQVEALKKVIRKNEMKIGGQPGAELPPEL